MIVVFPIPNCIFDGSESSYTESHTIRCRVKNGWDQSGKEGYFFGYIQEDKKTQRWAIVCFDDGDPELYKANALELATTSWIDVIEYKKEV